MSQREYIGLYPGDTANPEEIAKDMANFVAEKELEQAAAEGFTYVGSYDKNSTEEEKKALIAKAVAMHEKRFFGEA